MNNTPHPPTTGPWFRSSYSNGSGGECVEASFSLGAICAVRDSKWAEGPRLMFCHGAWGAFVDAVRAERLS
ncbi:DUF397 domain-containing protein [Streptomyces sp. NBC_00212]|uniref:DUF397 domain-containing protein n=1 Tax=Streptomyces sp. NBC_00212 TaxID=2975684 RepID=UPI0032555C8B